MLILPFKKLLHQSKETVVNQRFFSVRQIATLQISLCDARNDILNHN